MRVADVIENKGLGQRYALQAGVRLKKNNCEDV